MTAKFSPALGAAKPLTIDDLQPADVLLSKGHGLISDLISSTDGGQYSHGALWSGVGIIQATGDGITLSEIDGTHDVYRYPALPKHVANEIVAIAREQVSGRYAYGELVMLGVLFLSGVRIKGALLERLLDTVGGPTASKLKAWLEAHAGRGTRVCTELVASSYYDAAGGRYALKISSRRSPVEAAMVEVSTPTRTRGAPPLLRGFAPIVDDAGLREGARAAAQSCLDLLAQNDAALAERPRKLLAGAIAIDATTHAPIGVVTPADLEFSDSLDFVGRLEA